MKRARAVYGNVRTVLMAARPGSRDTDRQKSGYGPGPTLRAVSPTVKGSSLHRVDESERRCQLHGQTSSRAGVEHGSGAGSHAAAVGEVLRDQTNREESTAKSVRGRSIDARVG